MLIYGIITKGRSNTKTRLQYQFNQQLFAGVFLVQYSRRLYYFQYNYQDNIIILIHNWQTPEDCTSVLDNGSVNFTQYKCGPKTCH